MGIQLATTPCPACEGTNFGIGELGACRLCGSANLADDAPAWDEGNGDRA